MAEGLRYSLIRQDLTSSFANNCKKTLLYWIELLGKTTLLNGITSADYRIITTFRTVDTIICGRGTSLLQRLANIQLMRLLKSLEDIIKSDRDSRQVHREPYHRDANTAMDTKP